MHPNLTSNRLTYYIALAATAAVILVSVLVFRQSDGVAGRANPADQTLNRGLIGDPESLHPHDFVSKQAGDVLRDISEGLITYSATGQLMGGVAESWEISADGRIYRFLFRKDVRWSNGDPVSPDDFVRSFRNLVDPKNGARNSNFARHIQNSNEIQRGSISPEQLGVAQIGNDILEITLSQNAPFFLQVLAHPSMFPIHRDNLSESTIGSDAYISNGAYTLEDWAIGSQLVLRKNNWYWGSDTVHFNSVSYHIVSERSEYDRFRANELDITGTIPPEVFAVARKEFPEEVKISPYLGTYYYGFNLSNVIFGRNKELRKALSLAIDRRILTGKVLGRGEIPAFGWVPPGITNYSSQVDRKLTLSKKEREAEANRLYAEAGFGEDNQLKFELRYNSSDIQQKLAVAIAAMWQEVLGVQATLVNEEFHVLLSNIREGEVTDLFRLSWTVDYDDPQSFLELFFSSNPSNMTGFRSQEFDDLIRKASVETDSSLRRDLLESAERLLLDEHPVIPIYFYVSKHLVSKNIFGWSSNVLDIHLSRHMSRSAE